VPKLLREKKKKRQKFLQKITKNHMSGGRGGARLFTARRGRCSSSSVVLLARDVLAFAVVFSLYASWRSSGASSNGARFFSSSSSPASSSVEAIDDDVVVRDFSATTGREQQRRYFDDDRGEEEEEKEEGEERRRIGGHGNARLVKEDEDREAFESSDEEPVDPSPPLPPSPSLPPPPRAPPPPSPLSPPPTKLPGEEGKEEDKEDEEYYYANKYTVLPRPDQSNIPLNAQEVRSDTNHPQWMKDMWAQQTKALTEEAKKELERKIYEGAIPPELSHAKPGDVIFVTFATHSVRDFAKNWVDAARRLKLEPHFVGALDEKMMKDLKDWNVPTMLLTGNSVLANRGVQFITAGSAAFKKMGTVKTKFVQDLLDMNLNPILSDADVVWMRDPRGYFNKGTYGEADILVSTDCIDVPGDKDDSNKCAHVNFNTGILHIRATEASKNFLQQWKTKVATSTIAWMRDQPAFNLLMHEGVSGMHLENAIKLKDPADRGKEGFRMVYYAANATVKLGVLPNWLFGNGHSYFVQWHHKQFPEDGEPYAVHTTYQYGDDGQYAWGKRERMRQAGIWTADDREYYEDANAKYLIVPDVFAQVKHANGPGGTKMKTVGYGKDDYRVAIERHFAEDKVRRETVRNLLALGKLLDRTVILPEPRCYCDKIWNNLNGCRAPGAEKFVLPYSCPMDHLYDLPSWFRSGLKFREPGFLADSRVPDSVRNDIIRVNVERRKNSALVLEGDDDGRAEKMETIKNSFDIDEKEEGSKSASSSSSSSSSDVQLPFGFTAAMAEEALKPFSSHAVIEFDYLAEEGAFCGFHSEEENHLFDDSVRGALSHYQYYCFTEPWQAAGAPRSGRHPNEPYEPQVVKRHCGEMDTAMRFLGKIHLGVIEHVNKNENPLQCTCEFGFAPPTPLNAVARGPACTHESHVSR